MAQDGKVKEIIILSRGWLLQLITGAQTHYMIGGGGGECAKPYKLILYNINRDTICIKRKYTTDHPHVEHAAIYSMLVLQHAKYSKSNNKQQTIQMHNMGLGEGTIQVISHGEAVRMYPHLGYIALK